MKPETKFKGSVKLAAIGDALGWITEFEKNKADIKKKYGNENINSFYKWEKFVGGRFNGYKDVLLPGSYSDDTQLLLAVARSINIDGKVDNEYFSKIELPNWLLYSRGAGRTIKNAARKIERKSAKWYSNFFNFKVGKKTIDYRESGANGAAMRILPIALANFGNIEKINSEIFKNSIVTHGHPRAIIGAMLYGYAINSIIKYSPDNFNFKSFITELGKDIEFNLSINEIIKSNEIQSWLKQWNYNYHIDFISLYNKTIEETKEYLRNIYVYISKDFSDNYVYNQIGCIAKETKGSGISTVIASIYLSSKYHLYPKKAIEIAVNSIGSDTDSIAAFTGGLLGALHGHSIIPEKWKKIQDLEYLDKIATSLLNITLEKEEINFIKKTIAIKGNSINDIKEDIYNINDIISFIPLGKGKITNIDRQKTLTKGKYNLIIDVEFDIGQTCRFSKLLRIDENPKYFDNQKEKSLSIEERINNFRKRLSREDLKEFNKILEIVRNEK